MKTKMSINLAVDEFIFQLYISLFGGFVSMVEKEGLLSIFKGLTPTLILTTPQAGLMFGFYNLLKLLLKETSMCETVPM